MWNVCLDFHVVTTTADIFRKLYWNVGQIFTAEATAKTTAPSSDDKEQYSVGSWKQKTLNTTSE